MEIINAVLIFMALVLMWGALNLDRSPAARVEVDQSSQLNDSMTFLQKLRNKSPKEEVQSRRIRAFQANLAQISDENPQLLENTEAILGGRDEDNSKFLDSLIQSTENLGTFRLEERQNQETAATHQQEDARSIEEDLIELVGMIVQVQQDVAASSDTIEGISNSVEKVKTVVGY
mgnify:FL=1|tara:strand:- start:1317 stop:1841 length:525 start_codon:yes stop_codon:yes gene_type:complete